MFSSCAKDPLAAIMLMPALLRADILRGKDADRPNDSCYEATRAFSNVVIERSERAGPLGRMMGVTALLGHQPQILDLRPSRRRELQSQLR